jgi:hypothetical protein
MSELKTIKLIKLIGFDGGQVDEVERARLVKSVCV